MAFHAWTHRESGLEQLERAKDEKNIAKAKAWLDKNSDRYAADSEVLGPFLAKKFSLTKRQGVKVVGDWMVVRFGKRLRKPLSYTLCKGEDTTPLEHPIYFLIPTRKLAGVRKALPEVQDVCEITCMSLRETKEALGFWTALYGAKTIW